MHSAFLLLVLSQDILFEARGTDKDQRFGAAIGNASDVNGDGVTDVLIGAPHHWTLSGIGHAFLHSGADGTLLFDLFEGESGGAFGYSVGAAGDVDADGVSDVIVGAPGTDQNGLNSGSARVFSGSSGALLLKIVHTDPYHDFNYLGICVGGFADQNLDGRGDVLVSAPFETFSGPGVDTEGALRLHSGRDGAELFRALGPDHSAFGWDFESTPDLTGDAVPDIFVGAPKVARGSTLWCGKVFLISGADGSEVRSMPGIEVSGNFGHAVCTLGDVDADGMSDVLVGAPHLYQHDAQGYARVLSGRDFHTIHTFSGAVLGDEFGYSVASAGDANGDRVSDLLVGAPQSADSGASGYVRLYSGKTGALLQEFRGAAASEQFGSSVALLPDWNEDDRFELAFGAAGESTVKPSAGYARVQSGDDLFLRLDPPEPVAGTAMNWITCEGDSAQPTMLVLTEIDGVLVSVPLFGLGFFDLSGSRTASATIPKELAGRAFRFRAFGLSAATDVLDTGNELLVVR